MKYKVLLIESSQEICEKSKYELEKRGLSIVDTLFFSEGLDYLIKDGDIQIVLVNWEVHTSQNNSTTVTGEKIFKEILRLRPEVDIFLFTRHKDPRLIKGHGLISGYFFKMDFDYDDIKRKIFAAIEEKSQTPFFDALVKYANKANDSWHTPGHSSGDSVKNSPWVKDYYDFFGHNMFASDISVSVPSLDSLLSPKPGGVIDRAQHLAAKAFRAKKTFFVTNGTSTSNKIIIQTIVKPGDAILMDRNCHKSVHYSVVAAGAEPIYMLPSVNNKYGIFGPIPKKRMIESMDKALNKGKKVKAIIVTNCTYDGLIYDIESIVKEAHKRHIKVIVDEAWFGYANFHHCYYPTAMAAGADYATQSTHKTMSAFSQASMLHVNDPDFESIEEFFMENYMMYTSTSPGYPMIASLDVARKQMVMEGYKLLSHALDLAKDLKESINSLDGFSVLELKDLISSEIKDDNIRHDDTKITIDISKSGYTNNEIEAALSEDFGIQIEKSTFNTITLLITIGTTRSKTNRLFLALESLSRKGKKSKSSLRDNDIKLVLSDLKYLPRHAFYCTGELMDIRDAEGKIATVMAVPYPPGIPILIPGQIITKDIIKYLTQLTEKGVEIHGMDSNNIKVATENEEKQLKDDGYEIS
ncbi:MAG: aminotransferase class V-fold PLP-dependent enzyme [Candidatus Marinimicrobia bacterium]|nr:aminotransferase class V-fold PLP-dependent enzyme [Candidatus Neomarinimicrobiota bacterium]